MEADERSLKTAATFKALFRLSLADTIITSYARIHNAILVHKDPEYEVLKQEIQLESLPYKKK
ncbi:MAG: hypothetical protein ACRCYY_07065 [Trueperaceae bacterium]